MKALLCLLLCTSFFSLHNTGGLSDIKITWKDKLDGDFSFSKKQSISCEAWCYEWAGTDKIIAKRKSNDTVFCYTATNTATHCSLEIVLIKNTCIPTIRLISIVANGSKVYECMNGSIEIDKEIWGKGILKANFDFNFVNDENDKQIYWKGKIFTKIH